MPFVTEDMLRGLVIRYRETAAPLVVSQYGGVQAPPTLYDRCLFAELGAESGEGSGKKVYRDHRARAAVVEWPAAGLADIDRPEDWELIRAAAAVGSR
jgi:CTP:molybdopterin cytidylyltransferase MocA